MSAPVSLQDQLECAKRELAMRRRVYPKFVDSGRMTPRSAEREIRAMSAIVDTLVKLIVPS